MGARVEMFERTLPWFRKKMTTPQIKLGARKGGGMDVRNSYKAGQTALGE